MRSAEAQPSPALQLLQEEAGCLPARATPEERDLPVAHQLRLAARARGREDEALAFQFRRAERPPFDLVQRRRASRQERRDPNPGRGTGQERQSGRRSWRASPGEPDRPGWISSSTSVDPEDGLDPGAAEPLLEPFHLEVHRQEHSKARRGEGGVGDGAHGLAGAGQASQAHGVADVEPVPGQVPRNRERRVQLTQGHRERARVVAARTIGASSPSSGSLAKINSARLPTRRRPEAGTG